MIFYSFQGGKVSNKKVGGRGKLSILPSFYTLNNVPLMGIFRLKDGFDFMHMVLADIGLGGGVLCAYYP